MRTIILFIYLGFAILHSALMIIVDKIISIKPESAYKGLRRIAKRIDAISGNKYEVVGRENLPTEPVLIVSNHESFFDPVTTVDLFEEPIALIGKIELTKIPTLAYWVTKFGCDFIDRDNMKQSIRVIIGATKTLKSGTSVLIYPEGTRSLENMEFKAGSFKIAQNAKAGILPITLTNTAAIFERNKFLQIKKAKPIVTIHPVIKYEDYKDLDLITVAANVEAIIYNK